MTEQDELTGYLPGMAPVAPSGSVRLAFEKTINAHLKRGSIGDEHAGYCAALIRLGDVIDREQKGYAIAHATAQAVEIMNKLLEIAEARGDDEFRALIAMMADD